MTPRVSFWTFDNWELSKPEQMLSTGVGHDGEFARMLSQRATRPKRIAIIGSSLSCLTAAWVAASRGHRVVVYEPAGEIGGMQRWRAAVPGQGEYAETIEAFKQRAEEAGVAFRHEMPQDDDFDTLWVLRRYQASASRSVNGSFAVLAGNFGPAAGQAFSVFGHDLVSAEAALVLAERGARVTLRSPKADIALDAHPGYRALVARLLLARQAHVLRWAPTSAGPPDRAEIGGAAGEAVPYGDESGWDYPYGNRKRAVAFIDDAYEPGAMTRGIYAAVELAAA